MIDRLAAIAGGDVSRETFEKIEAYAAMLREESQRTRQPFGGARQQLVGLEPRSGLSWVDIGSGAGLPGIVIACLVAGPVTLIEPRRLRAEFLHRVCESLKLNASVFLGKAERAEGSYDVITARAVTNLSNLLKISAHLSTRNSRWVLPKGRNAERELVEAQQAWQGAFHVERSATDPESRIIVGTGVRARP